MPTKSRSRKRKEYKIAPIPAEPARVQPDDGTNISPFEGTLSVYAGVLLLAAALFPRTLKQLILLGLGGAFLYRGQSRHCHVYSAAGIDTNKAGLLGQVNAKLLS